MTNSHHNSRGLWIAFFGPDGIGKSAVVERLTREMGPAFSGIRQFHFRPMFRARTQNNPPTTKPHAKAARGRAASYCKLIYWFVDCWCGYLAFILRGLKRSELVVFDRYYPDILVDPRRYRMSAACLKFARVLSSLAPQPDLYILLDAPTEIVQSRKQEVSFSESQRQRAAYLNLFTSLPNTLIVNADRPIEDVARQVNIALSSFVTHFSSHAHEVVLLANS